MRVRVTVKSDDGVNAGNTDKLHCPAANVRFSRLA